MLFMCLFGMIWSIKSKRNWVLRAFQTCIQEIGQGRLDTGIPVLLFCQLTEVQTVTLEVPLVYRTEQFISPAPTESRRLQVHTWRQNNDETMTEQYTCVKHTEFDIIIYGLLYEKLLMASFDRLHLVFYCVAYAPFLFW